MRVRGRQSLAVRACLAILAVLALTAPGRPAGAEQEASSVRPDWSADLQEARRLIESGRFAEAEQLARRALAGAESTHGGESIEAAEVLQVVAEVLRKGGKGLEPETRKMIERAVRIQRQLLAPDDLRIATSLNTLGILLKDAGDYVGARSTHEEALRIREKALSVDHTDVAASLSNLGNVALATGDLTLARGYYERALAIERRAFGERDIRVARGLNRLAILLRTTGDYPAALPLYQQSLEITEERLGRDHLDVAGVLNGLAALLERTGDFPGARQRYERALAIRKKHLGPRHHQVAEVMHNLGYALLYVGDYAEARGLLDEGLDIMIEARGARHANVAAILQTLGRLDFLTGDLAAAEASYSRAMEIWTSTGHEPHRVETCLHDLAAVAEARCALREALSLYERALALGKGLGKDHEALSLSGMARVHSALGEVAEATRLYEHALALQKEIWGTEHREVARTLSDLAGHLAAAGDDPKAREFYQEALRIRERVLGRGHPALAESLVGFAGVLSRSGQGEAALDAALSAEAISRSHLMLTARTLPERQALAYASARPSGLDLAIRIVDESPKTVEQARLTWDAIARSRALVLDELASRHRAVAASDDAESSRLAALVEAHRTLLANLTIRGPDPIQPPESYPQLLEQARLNVEQAERALAIRSLPFRNELAERRAGLAALVRELPPSSALVSFRLYTRPRGDRSGSLASCLAGDPPDRRYLAFVLRGGDERVTTVPIGAAAEIDELVSQWRQQAGGPAWTGRRALDRWESDYRAAGEALRKRIWDPLTHSMGNAELLLIVPDGALSLVSFASLPVGASGYLVEGGPRIHYLSAERDLMAHAAPSPRGHGLLAIGGPDFERASAPAAIASGGGHASGGAPSEPLVAGEPAAGIRSNGLAEAGPSPHLGPFTGRSADCADFRQVRFEPLPASAREAKLVSDLWMQGRSTKPAPGSGAAASQEVMHLQGADATEPALKRNAPGRRALHVATHGFFLEGRCASALTSARGVGGLAAAQGGLLPSPAGDNPMLLAGLVLAGANRRQAAGPVDEDGILTAEEIAALDLSGVEWAVLSACETGVGSIREGEGVFGLRRAFQVAGARSLIMSLWSVEDEPARQWMQSLYESRFIHGRGTAEAVHQATLEQLRSRRARGDSTHPFYWAGFVAAGDWR